MIEKLWFEELPEECGEKLKELLEYMVVDPLLKIPNRYFFYLFMKRESELCKRYGLPISVIFVDADNLKMVNDIYGHKAGDRYLLKIVEVIQKNIRNADLLIRWGGDEFVIILHTDKNGVEGVRRRLYDRFEKENLKINGAVILLSASIGIASGNHDIPLDKLVELADKDMLEEKRRRKGIIKR